MRLSRSICANRMGVAMATSSLLMFFALSPDSLSSNRPVHFLPFVSFENSSKVCFANSREGSTMTTRANSLPGLPIRASNGPRKAIVFPLPVGADARMWLPAITAGKHCIWIGVGLAKPRPRKFVTNQSGTPCAGMSSKDAKGSGAPALTWIRFRRLKAATSSFCCAADFAPPAFLASPSAPAWGFRLPPSAPASSSGAASADAEASPTASACSSPAP
mmetsp:Transcript_64577/g.185733  ORF Transcript_64577/g.185733 Transcript_64577/m.185733 type:complete len:218 (+) Transcript_64577:911-1564(+)